MDDSEPYKTGWGCDPYWGWIVKTGDTGKRKKLRTMVMCYAWVQALLWFEICAWGWYRVFHLLIIAIINFDTQLDTWHGVWFGAVFLPTLVRVGGSALLSSIYIFAGNYGCMLVRSETSLGNETGWTLPAAWCWLNEETTPQTHSWSCILKIDHNCWAYGFTWGPHGDGCKALPQS